MNRLLAGVLALGMVPVAQAASAAPIYRCDATRSVVFSDRTCGGNARPVQLRRDQPAAGQAQGTLASFQRSLYGPASALLAAVGAPDARFRDGAVEYWYYSRVVKADDALRLSPEVVVREGRVQQLRLVPLHAMRGSIQAARNIGDWTPPSMVSAKTFGVRDSRVDGQEKAVVAAKLGLPDAKRVANGREVWVYEQVPMASSGHRSLSVALEFEADRVVSAIGY